MLSVLTIALWLLKEMFRWLLSTEDSAMSAIVDSSRDDIYTDNSIMIAKGDSSMDDIYWR